MLVAQHFFLQIATPLLRSFNLFLTIVYYNRDIDTWLPVVQGAFELAHLISLTTIFQHKG